MDLLTQRFRDFCKQRDEAGARSEAILERIQRDKDEIDDKLNTIADIDDAFAQLSLEIEKNQKGLVSTQALIESQNQEIDQTELLDVGLEDELEALSGKLKSLTDVIVIEFEEKLKQSGYNLEEKRAALALFESKLSHIDASLREQSAFLEKLKTMGVPALEEILQQQKDQTGLQKAFTELKELFA